MHDTSILWRWVSRPGHEAARLTRADGLWQLTGMAAFAEGDLPVQLQYTVICDDAWRTQSATVIGSLGNHAIEVEVLASASGEWSLNGLPQPGLAGCVDVDLNFSPSTNLLPVRRLGLEIGEHAIVRAAWLRFPTFRLEALEQTYTRIATDRYEYESGGGQFRAEIQVDAAGFALDYAGVWQAEASFTGGAA